MKADLPPASSPPSFFWQGTLILLPVLLLTAIGFHSLRQDRIQMEASAKEQLTPLAEESLEIFQNVAANLSRQPTLIPTNSTGHILEISSTGDLVSPVQFETLPNPQLLYDRTDLLSDQQRQLWTQARASEFQTNAPAQTIAAFEQFLKTNPPQPWHDHVEFSRAVFLAKAGQFTAATNVFLELLASSKGRSPAGLPIAHLAAWQLNAHWDSHTAPDANLVTLVCSRAISSPSLLSADLVAGASNKRWPGAEYWSRVWKNQQEARDLFSDFIAQWKSGPGSERRSFWFAHSANYLLAMPVAATSAARPPSTSTNAATQKFVIYPDNELRQRFTAAGQSLDKRLPGFFNYNLALAGRVVKSPARPAPNSAGTPWLSLTSSASPPVQLSIFLSDPDGFYSDHRQRVFRFSALITAAALAAIFGWWSSWRASRRQWALSQMKSNFVSSVSHELRAPIASIRLLAETLHRGNVPQADRQREYFRLIVQECRRLSLMIQNVLDFSRIEQNRREYEFEPSDFGALVDETVQLMKPVAEAKGISLCLRISPVPDSVPAPVLDGRAIQQALINLIDNAIKHSPPRENIEIELTHHSDASKTDRTGDQVRWRLSVRDHGPGIPVEEHAKIFERFYRIGSELRRETAGVGLGLSITNHIVAAHGGVIELKSAPGQGSCFMLVLPERQDEAKNVIPKS